MKDPERMKVDPELAREWLSLNTHNRNHRPGMVAAYAEAMQAGDWHTDVDPIAFAGVLGGRGKNAPVLLNGQHRLLALVEAEVTLEFLVVQGLSIADQADMDAGIRRQLGDQLRLMGHPYSIDLAAVLRLVYGYEHDTLRGAMGGVAYSTLLRFLADHPDLPESVLPAKRVRDSIGGPVSVYGAGHYILSCIDDKNIDDDVEEFYVKLQYGEGLDTGSPILAYRNQAIASQNSHNVSRRRKGQANQLALLFKAWNAWRNGTHVASLSWRGGGKHAESFPVPE
jgi:hypothetical protein